MNLSLVNLKVIYFAILRKVKHIFKTNYDPYLPLPDNLYLSPSSKISHEYKNTALSFTYIKSLTFKRGNLEFNIMIFI